MRCEGQGGLRSLKEIIEERHDEIEAWIEKQSIAESESERMPEQVTWEYLTQLEPRLLDLEREIKRVKRPPRGPWCANAVWYGYTLGQRPGFKPRLLRLVGWDAKNARPELRTARVYDLAYRHLYELLPDCRDCRCISSAVVG